MIKFTPQHLCKLWHSTLILCSKSNPQSSNKFRFEFIFQYSWICFLYIDMDFSSIPHWGGYFKGHEDVMYHNIFWLFAWTSICYIYLTALCLWLVFLHNLAIGFCGIRSYLDFLATFLSLELEFHLVLCGCDFGLLHIHWPWGFCWLLKAFHLRLLFMIFKPSCFVLHELKTVVDRTIKRSSLTLVTCLVYITNLANLDLTFTNMITFKRDSLVPWIQHLRLEVGFLLCKQSFVICLVLCTLHTIPRIEIDQWMHKSKFEVFDHWTSFNNVLFAT